MKHERRATLLACPHCLTLVPHTVEQCPHCRQAIAWLRDIAEFCSALSFRGEASDRPWQLQVEASWPGGGTKLMRPGAGTLELLGFQGESIHLAVRHVHDCLHFGEGQIEETMELPGEREWRGVHIRARLTAVPGLRRNTEKIVSYQPGEISLGGTLSGVVIGKRIVDGQRHVQVPDACLEGSHCLVVRQPGRLPGQYWIVDLGTDSGTYVNRQEVLVHRFQSGDLLQLGGYAWLFNGADGMLVPVRGIEGVRLQIRRVERLRKLGGVSLDIEGGQLLAICGPSAAGKTTLLEAIAGGPGCRDDGVIHADGQDIDEQSAWYRCVLGYVSQRAFVHEDLTASQAVSFSARFRHGSVTSAEVAEVLRQVDLPEERWSASPKHLSGGESNRVRTATELIGRPRLFLLDEPTSGLDPDREVRLLSFLRSLSLRGCTVVVVIHSLHRLDLFDRVVVIAHGGVRFVGTPGRLRKQIPSGDFLDLDFSNLQSQEAPEYVDLGEIEAPTVAPSRPRNTAWPRQLWTQMAREAALLRNRPWKRFFLPVVTVPAVFALALSTVPSHQLELLGFLAVLSVIWLGASLSAQSIAGEREVLDHERRLFLRVSAYVVAKASTAAALAVVQASVFYGLLFGLRWWGGRGQLYGGFWPLVYLLPVACAGTGVGLLLSAIVGRNRLAAAFVLPLLMMVQIVFSVHVAGNGQRLLHNAYDGHFLSVLFGDAAAGEQSVESAEGPLMRGSYFTISRWGDIALRSFAYGRMEYEWFATSSTPAQSDKTSRPEALPTYRYWRLEAAIVLLSISIALPALTWAVLVIQHLDWRRLFRPADGRPEPGPTTIHQETADPDA